MADIEYDESVAPAFAPPVQTGPTVPGPMPMQPGIGGILSRAVNFTSTQSLLTPGQQKAELGLGLGLVMPGAGPAAGLLKTMGGAALGQGAASGITEAMTGGGVGEVAKAAGLGAAGGALGGAAGKAVGGVVKGISRLRGGPAATAQAEKEAAQYATDVAAREGKIASDKAMTTAVSETEKMAAQEHVANQLTDLAKSTIPPLKNLPPGAKGLEDLTSVKSYDTVHKWFDSYIRGVKDRAGNMMIRLTPEEARVAGIKNMIASADKADKLVSVSAADAAEGMLGLSRKDPDLYKTIYRQLDDLKLIDPVASAGYKSYMGLKGFLEGNKLLKGGPLDLAKAQDALRTGGNKALQSRRNMAAEDIIKGTELPQPRLPQPEPPMPQEPKGVDTWGPSWLTPVAHAVGHVMGGATGVPAGSYAGGRVAARAMDQLKGLPLGPTGPGAKVAASLLQRLFPALGGQGAAAAKDVK